MFDPPRGPTPAGEPPGGGPTFVSTRSGAGAVGLARAIEGGMAPDGGLWVPEPLPSFGPLPGARRGEPPSFMQVATGAARGWLGMLDDRAATGLLLEACDLPIALRPLGEGVDRLDLTRGPSAAFKDVGARFLAALWSALPRRDGRMRTVLVATSGDTGGAVARAVEGRPGVRAVILFPPDRVSPVQRRQFTTPGGNVRAVGIEGDFDDAQRVVRELLADPALTERFALVSANSINPGRLLPQTLYYLYLALLLEAREPGSAAERPVVVPSGNLGNLTAALWARRMSARVGIRTGPIHAVVNENDALVRALRGEEGPVGPTVATDSTAMDVGQPSNLERLRRLAEQESVPLAGLLEAASIPVGEAREAQRRAARDGALLIDPHTAVGYALALRLRERSPSPRPVVIETAHPAKFPELLERVTGHRPDPPPALRADLGRREQWASLPPTREALEGWLEEAS